MPPRKPSPPPVDFQAMAGNREISVTSGKVTSHRGVLKSPLIKFIADSTIIVGCVAWITEPDILDALAGRYVALICQKEAWWKRADARGKKLGEGYASLTGGLPAYSFPDPLKTKGNLPLAPILCMGTTSGFVAPLMHHKFLVRCIAVKGVLVAEAVWTGSFNFSSNASRSFENAVVITDRKIAAAYLQEFAVVATFAEPMNWTRRAVTPGKLDKVYTPPKAAATKKRRVRKRA